jgi:ABC-type branched-subunit amino acid transport system substrate-binding protein
MQLIRLVVLCALASLAHRSAHAADLTVLVPVDRDGNTRGEITGLQFMYGVKTFLDRVNKEGGVNGRQIRIVEVDQLALPAKFSALIHKQFQAEPVAAILGCSTDDACLIAKSAAQEHHVPLIAPLSINMELANNGTGTVFSLRAPLQREVEALVSQLSALASSKIALLTETAKDSPSDRALLEALSRRKMSVTRIVAGTPADRAKLPQRLGESRFHAAILNIDGDTVAALIDAGISESPEWPRVLMTLANGNLEMMLRAFKGRTIGFTESVPNPERPVLPVARQLQQDVEKYGGNPTAMSYAGMEGYLAARLFVEATRRNAGREALQDALQRTGSWDLGGYRLDFSGGRVWGNEKVGLGTRSSAGYVIN